MMDVDNPKEELQANTIELLYRVRRELSIIKLICVFILMIVLFDYLLDIDWLGSKTRVFNLRNPIE